MFSVNIGRGQGDRVTGEGLARQDVNPLLHRSHTSHHRHQTTVSSYSELFLIGKEAGTEEQVATDTVFLVMEGLDPKLFQITTILSFMDSYL